MSIEEYNGSDEGSEDVDLSTSLNLGNDKELDFEDSFSEDVNLNELEQLAKKAKTQGSRFSLKARRAIEDHLEQRKLRKEVDYMFDDDFAGGEEEAKSKG